VALKRRDMLCKFQFLNATPSIFILLRLLTFYAAFDHLTYSKYQLKYVKLKVIFQLSSVIKQITTKYMVIFFKKMNNTDGET
jgi:hypothetical protein